MTRFFVRLLFFVVSVAFVISPARAQDRETFIFARGADAQKLDPADVDDGESLTLTLPAP